MPLCTYILPLLIFSLYSALTRAAFCYTPVILSPTTNTVSYRAFTITGFVNPSSCVEDAAPPSNWAYRGCFFDDSTTRAVPGGSYTRAANMTRARCIAIASGNGHSFAALVSGSECFTGNGLNPGASSALDAQCGTNCTGSAIGEKCGDTERASVLRLSSPYPTMPTILIRDTMAGQPVRISRVLPNATGHFSLALSKQLLGTHTYTATLDGDTTQRLRSNDVVLDIQCSKPFITQPSGADWLPNYNEYEDVILYSSRPTFSGTSDCPMIAIELSNQAPYTIAVDLGGFFNTVSRQVANGRYTLTVLASDEQGAYSSRSNQRNFVVDSNEPRATADVARRSVKRKVCKENERLCPFVGFGRDTATEFRCCPDLDYNLERCGACDGPDCSAIPDVDEVSCREGKCEVHSCRSGYTLWGDVCVLDSTRHRVLSRMRSRR